MAHEEYRRSPRPPVFGRASQREVQIRLSLEPFWFLRSAAERQFRRRCIRFHEAPRAKQGLDRAAAGIRKSGKSTRARNQETARERETQKQDTSCQEHDCVTFAATLRTIHPAVTRLSGTVLRRRGHTTKNSKLRAYADPSANRVDLRRKNPRSSVT